MKKDRCLRSAEYSFLNGIFQVSHAIGNIVGGFHNPRQWESAVWRQWWMGETPASHSYLMKKPGYYLSEEAYIERLRKELFLNGIFQVSHAIGNIVGGFHNPRQWESAVWRQGK
jgi:hypothetical protein